MHGSLLRVLSGCGRLDSNQRSSPYEGDEIGLFSTPRGCGGRTRTCDFQLMRMASYHCSTPQYIGVSFPVGPHDRTKMKGNEDNRSNWQSGQLYYSFMFRTITERNIVFGYSALMHANRRFWCLGTELNRRHEDFQSSALPTELPRHMCGPPLSRTGIDPQQIYFASLYFYKAFSTKPHIGLRSSFVASAGGSLICEIHVNALMVDLVLSISPNYVGWCVPFTTPISVAHCALRVTTPFAVSYLRPLVAPT